jgi:hypothetical protein
MVQIVPRQPADNNMDMVYTDKANMGADIHTIRYNTVHNMPDILGDKSARIFYNEIL